MQVATFYGETFRLRGVGAFDYLGRMPAQTTPIRELVNSLVTPSRADRLRHLEVLAPRAATHASWPEWVAPAVREAFEQRGVERPWQHQVEAAQSAYDGQHTVIATGTASGKSLSYQLPALTASLTQRGPRGERGAPALYIAPRSEERRVGKERVRTCRSRGSQFH